MENTTERTIAQPEEVLETLTEILRGESGDDSPKVSERLKAAELLVKYKGMFAEEEEPAQSPDVRQAAETLCEIMSRLTQEGDENE